MPKGTKQAEAGSHIRELLLKRGFDIPFRKITLEDDQHWLVFEHEGRQIGIDSASGIWVRASISEDWRCLAMPHTLGGALMAVDHLLSE